MSVRTIYVRFKNKGVFDALVLPFKDKDGQLNIDNIDVVGDIYDRDGKKVDGWHVNFSNTVPEVFRQYIIPKPNTPMRVFSGDI